MKARPDDFVVLVPHPFESEPYATVRQTHLEVWQEELELSEDRATLGGVEVAVFQDEPLPDIVQLAGTSLEPYGASALAMLESHVGIWRLVAPRGSVGARAVLRLVSSLVEVGVPGAFLPGIRRLHSPRSVQRMAMEISAQSLANFFVAAYDQDDWMRTRGLTPFGLPELETRIDSGLNAAYFRLMDVAAGMIQQGAPFPAGGTIELGPTSLEVVEGPTGPPDEEVPVNGLHGVLTLRSAT